MLTHSFPTRRSSDLLVDSNVALHDGMTVGAAYRGRVGSVVVAASAGWGMMRAPDNASGSDPTAYNAGLRSEEHTSELQSLMRSSSAVFCLKKKKQQKHSTLNL